MNQFDDEFLDHIKKVLQAHEEPYQEGAWERFASQVKPSPAPQRKTVSLLKWTAAVAAVIATVFLFAKIYSSLNPQKNPDTPAIATKQTPELPIQQPAATEENGLAAISPEPATPDQAMGTISSTDLSTQPSATLQYARPDRSTRVQWRDNNLVVANRLPAVPLISGRIPEPTYPTATVPSKEQPADVDFWKNRVVEAQPETVPSPRPEPSVNLAAAPQHESTTNRKEGTRRWQSSLYVSPVFGDLGVSMGYGYSLGYAINDKIKISSGIAHTKISGSRSFDPEPQPAAAATMAESPKGALKTASFATNALTAPQQTTSIQQVEGTLSGIDIPLELNYNISKKFYVSGGVSGLIVINDRKTYTLLDSRDVKVSVETNKGNIKEDKNVTFSNSSISSDPEVVPSESIPFLGFYNLSAGYKQKINSKNSVSLEPFVKIPVKNVTQQHLNYSGVGLRLKFDF